MPVPNETQKQLKQLNAQLKELEQNQASQTDYTVWMQLESKITAIGLRIASKKQRIAKRNNKTGMDELKLPYSYGKVIKN
jgi:TolA-binding protein